MTDICKTTDLCCIKCNPGPCEHREEEMTGEITKADAIAHFNYGISHDIFKEPVTTYAKLAIEALEKLSHYEDLEEQGRLIELPAENDFKRDELDRCMHRYCNKCDGYRKELQRYKDLEEQGRLFTIPCKIGDTLWQVIRSGFHCNYIQPIKLDYKNFYQLATGAGFGKTIFLTKEEAEAALKEK